MNIDAEIYARVRGQVMFLLSMVELLATSIDADAPIARAARRAIELARTAIDATEQVAEVYTSIANELEDLLTRVERLKSEGGAPTHVEWEVLRADLDAASLRIAAATASG